MIWLIEMLSPVPPSCMVLGVCSLAPWRGRFHVGSQVVVGCCEDEIISRRLQSVTAINAYVGTYLVPSGDSGEIILVGDLSTVYSVGDWVRGQGSRSYRPTLLYTYTSMYLMYRSHTEAKMPTDQG